MNKHKFVRELFDLPSESIDDLSSTIDMISEARHDFENVGVEFTYEKFKEYVHRRYDPLILQSSNSGNGYAGLYKRRLKIIDGDNLDIIEEAAKDKGLL